MWAIAKKDFKTLFYSPIGYIVVAVFLAIMGVIMHISTVNSRGIDFGIVYEYVAKFALPIVVSVVTMKSFSEEKNKDTEKLLFSSSKKTTRIIIGKILAVFMVVCIAVAFSLLYCIMFKGVSYSILVTTIFGFLILAFAYSSVGVLISSLTESQVISAVITLAFLFLPTFFSLGNGVLSYLSLLNFFIPFSMGLFSIKSLITLVTFSIACIILTSVEMKRKRTID